MEKEEDVYKRIGKNIAAYRRNAGITQAELARKINYSDKSVSKWESGNGVPDVLVLMRLAELFGVSVNELVGESPKERASNTFMRVMVLLISSALIWLIATATFVAMKIFASAHGAWWLVFVYAIPANAAMLAVFAAAFRQRTTRFVSITVLIWGVILSTFLTSLVISKNNGTAGAGDLWFIFLLGIPLQVAETLWFCLRRGVCVFRRKRAAGRRNFGDGERRGPSARTVYREGVRFVQGVRPSERDRRRAFRGAAVCV